MEINHLHEWNLTQAEAVALQNDFASKLINQPLDVDKVKLVAGVDVSVKNDISQAAVVVLTFPELEVIEVVRSSMPTPFPYIPGLLTFREGPALETAFAQLEREPDVFIFDGMGQMHPRRMGIGAHLGLWLGRPTVGCGKRRLVGKYDEPGNEKGDYSPLFYKGDQLGVVLRTRANVKPVYISPGHLCDIDSAIELVLRCTPKYRLPEPIRQAHNAAGEL